MCVCVSANVSLVCASDQKRARDALELGLHVGMSYTMSVRGTLNSRPLKESYVHLA